MHAHIDAHTHIHMRTLTYPHAVTHATVHMHTQVAAERIMDSNDLERERGITILAKNTAIRYKWVMRTLDVRAVRQGCELASAMLQLP